MTTTHDRAGYQRGCRCEKCCEANRVYSRERLRRKKSEIRAVVTVPAAQTPRGRVVEAVATDLASVNAFEERPGLASVAMVLAELLDNESAVPQHPAAAARLTVILMELIPATPVHRSGLQAVRDMTQ